MLTRIASLLIGAALVVLTAIFALSDLISITGGRVGLMAEALAVSYGACGAVAAALVLVLIGGARLQRRLSKPAGPKGAASPGRWIGAALAVAWVAFVTSPFLAPAVVAGDWAEAAKLVLMVGGLIVGFLVVVMLMAALTESRKHG